LRFDIICQTFVFMKINKNIRNLFFIILLASSFAQLNAQNLEGPSLQRKAKNGIYVLAHRGAHQGIPENSLAAYQKAIYLGCDFVEIDVRTTNDGKFVSMHNSSIDEYVSGQSGKVCDLTFAEIRKLDIGIRLGEKWKGTQVPTFEEILKLCQRKIGIYLDLKDAPVPALVELIRKYHMERDIIWYIPASNILAINQLVDICPDCVPMPDPGAEENIDEVLNLVKTSSIATDMDQLSRSFVEKAHQHKAMVFTDEKNGTEAEWTQIIDWKTDGIQTDRPEELISFLKRRKSNN